MRRLLFPQGGCSVLPSAPRAGLHTWPCEFGSSASFRGEESSCTGGVAARMASSEGGNSAARQCPHFGVVSQFFAFTARSPGLSVSTLGDPLSSKVSRGAALKGVPACASCSPPSCLYNPSPGEMGTEQQKPEELKLSFHSAQERAEHQRVHCFPFPPTKEQVIHKKEFLEHSCAPGPNPKPTKASQTSMV